MESSPVEIAVFIIFFSGFFFWSTSVKFLALLSPVCFRTLFIRSFSVVRTTTDKGLVKAGVQLLKVINVLMFVSLWLEHNWVSSQRTYPLPEGVSYQNLCCVYLTSFFLLNQFRNVDRTDYL